MIMIMKLQYHATMLRFDSKELVGTSIREFIRQQIQEQKQGQNQEQEQNDNFICINPSIYLNHIFICFNTLPTSLFDLLFMEDGKLSNEKWYQQIFDKKTVKILLNIVEKRLDFIDMLVKHYVDNTPFIQDWEIHSRVIERHKILSDAYKVLTGKSPSYAYAFYPYTKYDVNQFEQLDRAIDQYFEFMQTYPNNDLAKLMEVLIW